MLCQIRNIGLLIPFAVVSLAHAQQITDTVPFQLFGEGFSENFGTNFSMQGPNWFFSNNNQVAPPFGPSLVNSGTSGGVGFGGNGVSGNLNFNFAQSSNRSIVSSSPSLTTTSGFPGTFNSTEMRPFVSGLTPVVGNGSAAQNSLQNIAEADNQQKLSAIAAGRSARLNEQMKKFLRRAERGEEDGNVGMALGNYRLALSIADEPLRSQIQQKLNAGISLKSKQSKPGKQ